MSEPRPYLKTLEEIEQVSGLEVHYDLCGVSLSAEGVAPASAEYAPGWPTATKRRGASERVRW